MSIYVIGSGLEGLSNIALESVFLHFHGPEIDPDKKLRNRSWALNSSYHFSSKNI